jgi:hypothetical protein
MLWAQTVSAGDKLVAALLLVHEALLKEPIGATHTAVGASPNSTLAD